MNMRASKKRSKKKKKTVVRPGSFYTILTKGNKLWRNDWTKEKELWPSGMVN